ncbi:hypothetical protein N9Y60_02960 [Crocinitomicaceae bacterium]|nr:hypothetical protein [Crocinitomicaceae bacterium]MDB3906080.1 hypothetical protein [Crocinitomicaceae bacterium]
MSRSLFSGRRLCITTKHGKESVIGPVLEQSLGVECIVPESFDTDQLGTFSGEIERKGTPVETAREKCLRAMKETGCDLAVASEGSFGSYPTLFFVPADEEFLLLVDAKNDFEIIARHLTTETNFAGEKVTSWEALKVFADKAKFPDHALIVKNAEKDWKFLQKGIQNEAELRQAFEECKNLHSSVFVETDMRAMLNPMRMNAIAKATEELVRKIESECPNCEMPGFDVVEHQAGLPCSNCSMPTKSTLQDIYRCAHCHFEKIEKFPRGKDQEDPMYCDFCNP